MTTNSPNNVYISNGQLYIMPTLTSDSIGGGYSAVMDGATYTLDGCTASGGASVVSVVQVVCTHAAQERQTWGRGSNHPLQTSSSKKGNRTLGAAAVTGGLATAVARATEAAMAMVEAQAMAEMERQAETRLTVVTPLLGATLLHRIQLLRETAPTLVPSRTHAPPYLHLSLGQSSTRS